MRLESYLEQSAARFPDKVCLVAGDARLTYREVNDTADRVARGLCRRGVGRGDRVIVFLENTAEAVVSVFAVLKAGAVLSMVNPATKAEKLGFILSNSRAKAVVAHPRLLPVALAAAVTAPTVATIVIAGSGPWMSTDPCACRVVSLQELIDAPDEVPGAGVNGDSATRGIDLDLATIIYTSGSTGVPKGVMMTHANLDAACESIVEYLRNDSDDVLIGVLPLSFGYGLNQLLTAFRVGATLVLERGFVFPHPVVQRIRSEKVTGFALVPTVASVVVNMKDFTAGSCPHLRYITNAAAAMSPAHLLRLQELFPSTRIYSMYGQTECTRTLYLPPDQLKVRSASVGITIPNTEAWVANEDGTRSGPGEVGELVVRGRHVTPGYWGLPEETARALRPGPLPGERVLYSGDLFRQDAEGYFYFVSRRDDIIKIKGQKVSPREVEDVLYRLPGVRDALVVGVPDPIAGTALVAVIVPTATEALTEAEVKRHCASHLEDVMTPSRVEFRDELPRTVSGKLLRREVQADLAARAAKTVDVVAGADALELAGAGRQGQC